MLRLYLAWRMLRPVRHAILASALVVLLAAAASGRLSQIAQRVRGPDVSAIQKNVQDALRPRASPYARSTRGR